MSPLPKDVFGRNAGKAFRDSEKGEAATPEEPTSPVEPVTLAIPEYVRLIGLFGDSNKTLSDLLVSTKLKYFEHNWNETIELLDINGEIMLNPRHFMYFLSTLRNGANGRQIVYDENLNKIDPDIVKKMYEDILDPEEGDGLEEWLNASFKILGPSWLFSVLTMGFVGWKRIYIEHKEFKTFIAAYESKSVEPCFSRDAELSLAHWLDNATFDGLPPKKCPWGHFYYTRPKDGCVATFHGTVYGSGLDCSADPSQSETNLGVRPAKIMPSRS